MSLPYALIARDPSARVKSFAGHPTASTGSLAGSTSKAARKVSRPDGVKAKSVTPRQDFEAPAAWRSGKSAQPFRIRRFQGRDGNEVVLLIDRGVGPAFWPTVFVTSEFLKAGLAASTCEKALYAVAMARAWFAVRNRDRDLDTELRQGDFIGLADADALADHLMLSLDAQAVTNDRASRLVTSPRRVVDIERFRPNPTALRRVADAARPEEFAVRIAYVAKYMEWHLMGRVRSDRPNAEVTAVLEAGKRVIARLLQRGRVRRRGSGHDEGPEGLSRDVVDRVSAALRPGSPDNPFQPGFLQARNELLWHLHIATGGRREEIQSVLVRDVFYAERRMRISKSKTTPREVPVGPEAAELFDRFVADYWSGLPKAARARRLLFTSETGEPLGKRGVNHVFEAIRERVRGVPATLTPHALRRTWNDRFSEMVDNLPLKERLSPEAEIKTRNRLQGWSPNSEMGMRYARRHLRRKADALGEMLAATIGTTAEDPTDG